MATRTRDFARTTLRPRHRRVVRGFAEALFSHEVVVSPERLDAFVEDVDDFVSPASKPLRAGLLIMLEIVRWSPLFLVRKFSLFEELSLDDRTRMLEKMERSRFSPFALIFVAYKTVLTMAFFENEKELAQLGYPGEERKRYKLLTVSKPPSELKS
jgi:hypothetical protein